MGKKKGKSGGKKGRKIVDGLSTAEMSREQLLAHIKRLQSEIEREREERNFFMLEREKLFSLWSLALEKINIEKTKARTSEIRIDDVRERKEEEMTIQRQKVRYLMSEQVKTLGQTRLDYLHRVKDHQKQFWKAESVLRQSVADQKAQASATRLCLLQTARDLQLKNLQNVSSTRSKYAADLRRSEVEADIRMIKYQDNVDLESKQDLIQLQVTKDEQIHHLTTLHQEQLDRMKTYYSEIVVNNLAIIATLQEELEESKGRENKLVEDLRRCSERNRELSQSVKELEAKKVEWTDEEKKMTSRITQIKRMNKGAERLSKNLKRLEIINEALVQKGLEGEEEKAFLRKMLAKEIMDTQMKSTMNQIIIKRQELRLTDKSNECKTY